MPIAFVQQCASANNAGASTQKIIVSAQTTQGNRVILAVRGGGAIRVSSLTDTQGNQWSIDSYAVLTGGVTISLCSAYLATALGASDSISATMTASGGVQAVALEYSGIATGTYVDGTPATTTNSSGTTVSLSTTPANASDMVLFATAFNTSTPSPTVSGPFTLRGVENSTNSGDGLGGAAVADDPGAGTSSVAGTWTTTSAGHAAVMVCYLAAASLPITGQASLTVSGTLAAAGQTAHQRSLALAAGGLLTAHGATAHDRAVALSATAALTASGNIAHDRAVALSATAALTASGNIAHARSTALSASAALTAAGNGAHRRSVTVAAAASLTAAGSIKTPALPADAIAVVLSSAEPRQICITPRPAAAVVLQPLEPIAVVT